MTVLFSLINLTNAQESRLELLPTIGVTSPILDNGIGFHVGLNPYVRINKRVSAEGQLSYIYTNITSSFLSGNISSVNSVNTLVGGRIYVNPEDKNTRFFLNLLIGLNYLKETNNIGGVGEYNVGFSGGTFIELNRVVIGLTFDTPQNLIFKLGYAF